MKMRKGLDRTLLTNIPQRRRNQGDLKCNWGLYIWLILYTVSKTKVGNCGQQIQLRTCGSNRTSLFWCAAWSWTHIWVKFYWVWFSEKIILEETHYSSQHTDYASLRCSYEITGQIKDVAQNNELLNRFLIRVNTEKHPSW